MSHLHLPDGVVPIWLWAPALPITFLLLVLANRSVVPQRVAYQGALGALMLASMAIPLGPVEFHLTLAGPIGILLGASGALPVVFVVSAILAFLGHGGLTVIGLNTLVLGAAAATASAAFRIMGDRLRPSFRMALATVAGQLVSSVLWAGIVLITLRASAAAGGTVARTAARLDLFTGLALALWIVGTVIESLVAFGVGRFLASVHPALLPGAAERAASEASVTA